MTKGPSPLLGYNTNVRHKGRVFHIQTEDSGISHPHVITHLFADGGRILKSNKTSYADIVSAPDMAVQVKKIMQDQHKAMFIALRDGQFDHLFEAAPADSKEASAPAISGDLMSSAQMSGGGEAAKRPSAASLTPAVPSVAPAAAPVQSGVDGPRKSSSVSMPALRPPMPPGVTAPEGPARPPSTAPAARPSTAPPAAPPAATSGSTTSPMAPLAASGPPTGSSTRPASQRPPARPAGASGHYQAVRSPDILTSFKPRAEAGNSSAPPSIFGDGLMSEKSLDEVILAYLAEDLDDSKR
jgi:hypothetical protein